MKDQFIEDLYHAHRESPRLPSPALVCNWLDGLLGVLFPEFSNERYASLREFQHHFNSIKLELYRILDIMDDGMEMKVDELEATYMQKVPRVRQQLIKDAEAIHRGDPAAISITEVIRTYPGFYAIAVYRLAHEFLKLGVPLIPRILTEHAHGKTGIDIHPGAIIGQSFCIDHGTGVVVGETCHIGDNVKLYQGVTLGALSVAKKMAQTKRHPTVEDNVIIYSGATILGGDTVIGRNAIIGGNVWITKSVPPEARIYYNGSSRQRRADGSEIEVN